MKHNTGTGLKLWEGGFSRSSIRGPAGNKLVIAVTHALDIDLAFDPELNQGHVLHVIGMPRSRARAIVRSAIDLRECKKILFAPSHH